MSFLKGVFGPSKDEIWSQLAEELGGEFIKGGVFKSTIVEVGYKNWLITLDTYTVSHGKTSTTYTRLRAPYISTRSFHFKIYKKGVFSDLGKMLGMQDIITGHDDLDEAYIIKGNDEELVKELFSSNDMRALIMAQPKLSIEIKDSEGFFKKTPEEVDFLYFHEAGVIKDLERLKKLFLLVCAVLNSLYGIGAATEDDPQIDYR